MKHLLVQKKKQCLEVIHFLFQQGFTRFDLPQTWTHFDDEVYLLAKKIFKRGMPAFDQGQKNLIPKLHFFSYQEFLAHLRQEKNKKIFFVVDEGFLRCHKGCSEQICLLPHWIYRPSEDLKNLDAVISLIEVVPEGTRHLVSLGGGVTSDVCGFAAGLLSLTWDVFPTTLLSCVDAAIGGKTGVNFFPYGKNQLGLFYGSDHIYIVPEFFKSWDQLDVYCGLAEALKHVWIAGCFDVYANLFSKILFSHQKLSFDEWCSFVALNYQIKSFVVRQDPFETQGLRVTLNFGHTIAHVLEALGHQGKIAPIPHGIAVAMGMKFWIDNGFVKNKSPAFYDFLSKMIEISNCKIHVIDSLSKDDVLISLREDKKKKSKMENEICVSLPEYGSLVF